MLLIPVVLYLNWELVARLVDTPISNPFARMLFISHTITNKDGTQSYVKGYNVRHERSSLFGMSSLPYAYRICGSSHTG